MFIIDTSEIEEDTPKKLIRCKKHRHSIRDVILEQNCLLDIYEELDSIASDSHIDLLRIHIMDPFLFEVPYYLENLQSWASEADLLPRNGSISDGTMMDDRIRNIIILMNTASYYVILINMVLWRYKGRCDVIRSLLSEQVRKFAELSVCRALDDAIKCMERNTFFMYFSNKFSSGSSLGKRAVNAAIIIAHYYLYSIQSEESSWEKQAKELDEHQTKQNEPNPLKDAGNEEFKHQRYMQAIASYTKAINQWPYNPFLYGNRALCYLKLRSWGFAEFDGYRAIILKSRWCKGYYRLSQAVAEQNKYVEALSIASYGVRRCQGDQELSELVSFQEQLQKKVSVVNIVLSKFKDIRNPASNEDRKSSEAKKQVTSNDKKYAKMEDVPELVSDSSSDFSEEEDSSESFKQIKHMGAAKTSKMNGTVKSKESENSLFSKRPQSHKEYASQGQQLPKDAGIKEENEEWSPVNLMEEMKKGSQALFSDNPLLAVELYEKSLNSLLKTACKEDDIVVLRYALGTAYVEIGLYEELKKAISNFNLIINEHRSIRFPAAYYGLGCAYFKLNRFSEAIQHLEKVILFAERKFVHGTYTWPGTTTVISETKRQHLLAESEKLMQSCKCPPPPDAVCKYSYCEHMKEIRYTDPDFKGFIMLLCMDHCHIFYHPSCWKSIKSENGIGQDKEVLGKPCYTPDCSGTVIYIEIKDKDGNIEWCHGNKDEKKEKHRKSRLEKKLQQRLQKSQRKSKNRARSVSETREKGDSDLDVEDIGENGISKTMTSATSSPEKVFVLPNVDKNTRKATTTDAKPHFMPAGEAKFILSKNKDVEECSVEKKSKSREKKASKGRKVMSIDEFCGDLEVYSAYNSYLARVSELKEKNEQAISREGVFDRPVMFCSKQYSDIIPTSDGPLSTSLLLPQDLRNDPATLEACFKSYNLLDEHKQFGPLHEEIYRQVQDFLSANGPIDENDEIWTDIAASFSPEAQDLIGEHGGLISFLLQSTRFTRVRNYICLLFDVMAAYNKYNEMWSTGDDGSEFYPMDMFATPFNDPTCEDAEADPLQSSPRKGSFLNPDAPEYQPPLPATESEMSSGDSCLPAAAPLYPEPSGSSQLDVSCGGNGNSHNSTWLSAPEELSDDSEEEAAAGSQVPPPEGDDSSTEEEEEGDFEEMCEVVFPVLESLIGMNKDRLAALLRDFLDMHSTTSREELVDKETQTGTGGMVKSIAVQANDTSDARRLKQMVEQLQRERRGLEERYQRELEEQQERLLVEKRNLEERLQEAMDSLVPLQKKVTVEIPMLQAEAAEAAKDNERIKSQLEQEREAWGKERKKLQQEKKKAADETKQVQQKLQAGSLQKDMQDQKIKELTSQLHELKTKLETEQHAYDQALVTSLWASCEEATSRAKKAEVEWLKLKKTETAKEIACLLDAAYEEINALRASNPSAQQEWSAYIETLVRELSSFNQAADAHISAVQEGQPLSSLGPFPTPSIPEKPRSPLAPLQRLPLLPTPSLMPIPQVAALVSPSPVPVPTPIPASDMVAMASAPLPTSTAAPKPVKNSQKKLKDKLKSHFQNLTDEELDHYISVVRSKNNNTLTGQTFQNITLQVAELVELDRQGAGAAPKVRKTAYMSDRTRSDFKSSSTGLDRIDSKAKCPWAKVSSSVAKCWGGEEVTSCSICLDELSLQPLHKLECGHTFHSECIKNWIKKERTCPNCRILILTSDEFPSLDS